jgi:hypothetical protein
MKIKFPFAIRQVDSQSVEIDICSDAAPIVDICINPDLAPLIPDDVIDKLYKDAVATVVRACIVVETK